MEKFKKCIDACLACAINCNHCASMCLCEQDVKTSANCIKLDKDCASICLFAAEAMASNSKFVKQICALCAEICDACATECEKLGMQHCKVCAEACRQCAKECREMAA